MATYEYPHFTLRQWADDFLAAIGAPRTAANEQLVVAWEEAESDQSGRKRVASWNPLNTTNKAPGSSSFNSVGVQNFPDLRSGVEENARALITSGYYPTIVRGLQAGDAQLALSNPREWSTWGTGGGTAARLAAVESNWPAEGDRQLANAQLIKTGSGLDPIGSFEDLAGGITHPGNLGGALGSLAGTVADPTGLSGDVLGLATGDWHAQLKKLVLIGVFAAGALMLVGVGVFRLSAPVREPLDQSAQGAAQAAAVAA